MENLDQTLQLENKYFWDAQFKAAIKDENRVPNHELIMIAHSIRWAAIVIAKEIREKGNNVGG